jgi:hypothetical protein
MASVIQPPPPPPPFITGPRAEELLVDEQIQQTRRTLKFVDFCSGMLTLVIGVLLYLLAMSVIEHWVIPGGWNGPTRVILFCVMLAGMGWYSWRTFWPLFSRPINPAYAAQLIERSTPSLKNSLLNFLLLRGRRQQLSQKVYQAIEQQAAQRLSEVSLDTVVDRTALLRLGYVLVAVVAICALYRVFSPKNLTSSMERVLMPWSNTAAPSRVEILEVTPGNTEIARGEHLEITAKLQGLRHDEAVRVYYSTLDKQAVDRNVLLSASEGGSQFRGLIPDRFSTGENSGVQQDLEYWIEAGDAKSQKYKVTVFARPTLVVEKIRYQYPAYTDLPPREVEGTGDVSALEGTKVTVYALANQDIATANVDFNADGRNDLAMSSKGDKASAQFTLALKEDRRTPEYDSYTLQYKTTKGRTSTLPPKYNIAVTPDHAPEVRFLAPANEEGQLVEQLDVPVDMPFTVEVEARDPDFMLSNVVILGEVAGQQVMSRDLLKQEHSGKFVGRMTATPQEFNLKPGDIVEYWVTAIDNRQPEPNITKTDKLKIRVLGPPDFGQQGQGEQQGEGQAGEQGESGESGEGESGEQGEGQAGGGAGESGEEQEGEGAAGQQGGEGESEGEQEGQSGQGGGSNEGENSDSQESQGTGGNSSSSGGDNQGSDQQEGQQEGDSQSSEGEGGGENQDGEQQGNPNGQGGDQSQGQSGEQGKVSSEGFDDGTAFERMSEHFAEQDQKSQGEGQSSDGESPEESGSTDPAQASENQNQSEQNDAGNETQSREGDGQGSPEGQQQSGGEEGLNQDQGIDGNQEGEKSEGSGAEGQPNEQREQQRSDAEQGDEGEKQEAPGGKMSTEQGEQGAGNNPGENEGSMDTDGERKPSDKSDEGKPDAEMNDQEAPGQSNSQKESDSSGANGGDRSGGGQEGAGQQADAEGTGTAGENTAADDGGGQASEQGAGETSSNPGQQSEADSPTGESSDENKPGQGSKESNEQGGNQPGGEQSQNGPGQDGEQPPEGEPANNQNPQEGQNNSQTTGAPGGGIPSGGGTGSNELAPPPNTDTEPGDAANLDYAKKQTDLVLDRLDDQLKKKDVDKELLDKLGWSEEELRAFVERWKNLKAEAQANPNEETQQELDKALRSLGLNPDRRTGFKSQAIKEKLRELQDSYRGRTPLEYADQVRAYMKGTATVPEEKEK